MYAFIKLFFYYEHSTMSLKHFTKIFVIKTLYTIIGMSHNIFFLIFWTFMGFPVFGYSK